jgi:hypothetical protein
MGGAEAWEPRYDIVAAVVVAAVVGVTKHDMNAVAPAIYAGYGTSNAFDAVCVASLRSSSSPTGVT